MFAKTIIRQGNCITELEKNLKLTKRNNKEIQKQLLDEFIMTINQIQDIQSLNLSEEEKDEMRNTIINHTRTKYVTKLIELSNTDQSFR